MTEIITLIIGIGGMFLGYKIITKSISNELFTSSCNIIKNKKEK